MNRSGAQKNGLGKEERRKLGTGTEGMRNVAGVVGCFVTMSGIWSCFSVVPVLRKVVAFLLLLLSIKTSRSSWRVCQDCVFLCHLTEGKKT